MNARNFIYIRRYNKPSAKRIADDKILAKELLLQHGIPTPAMLARFPDRESVRELDWKSLSGEFVIKPSRGYGGEGILVFKDWNGSVGTTVSGKGCLLWELESHIFDILDGVYSLQRVPDTAYIEERVKPASFFKKLIPYGLPDIRVIVFNKVPIMAMLRLPTRESEGTANLHRGAIGIGIGLRTGITFHAIHKNRSVSYIPDTKIKTRGIRIPDWEKILHLASAAAEASRLGFAGVDIVVDAEQGPLILEVNARPGLSIQLANKASLRTRLERLENMPILSPHRSVELSKSLFIEPELADRVYTEPRVLSLIEKVVFMTNDQELVVDAKIDTGAYRTSLDQSLVEELGLKTDGRNIFIKSASGTQLRPAVDVKFLLQHKRISTTATIADRKHLKYRLIIGRKDLKGFLVNPVISKEAEAQIQDEDIQP